MLNEFSQFIKAHFQRADNGLMQVILLNALSFVGLLLLKTVLIMAGHEAIYRALCHALTLPGSWATYWHQPWALLTHCWVHTSFFAMLWGLLLLYTLGQVVVNLVGSRHFIALYLLGGLVGGLLFLLLYHVSPHFQGTPASLLGFSGSLYAVMAAAATLAPQLPFSLLLLGPVKLKYIVGFLVLLALVDLSGTEPAASIAHLGGALLGYGYVKQLYGYPRLCQRWARLRGVRRALQVTYRKPTSAVKDKPEASVDQARLDRILDKVAASGYASLTPAEKQQLFEAGQ